MKKQVPFGNVSNSLFRIEERERERVCIELKTMLFARSISMSSCKQKNCELGNHINEISSNYQRQNQYVTSIHELIWQGRVDTCSSPLIEQVQDDATSEYEAFD